MTQAEHIARTADYVKAAMSGEGSGHDWWHVYRVWKNTEHICQLEGADGYVVALAALLHDVADHKFHGGDETVGPRVAAEWLQQLDVDGEVIDHVREIIRDLSYKGAGVQTAMRTLEGQVVQDADRLDAIGAIGIARAFAYGGHKGREIYNPDVPPVMHDSFEAYKTSSAPSLNHFYEKLLLLKDRMNTPTARAIAEQRHRFMELYLERFLAEWDGLDGGSGEPAP